MQDRSRCCRWTGYYMRLAWAPSLLAKTAQFEHLSQSQLTLSCKVGLAIGVTSPEPSTCNSTSRSAVSQKLEALWCCEHQALSFPIL